MGVRLGFEPLEISIHVNSPALNFCHDTKLFRYIEIT